ncbi:substrate-binding domain-containing protein [Sphingobacterium sp. BIGb0165]|uniref:substrate-binding domain-containing protein n=1 Tax=Sphingobacterium sp. BIGb0165 TaxID=2940615 RepID=UPI0021693A04|nr:substrate-binding domain-containing protein [Sphingobacterium sp. BIGb0165]MCS4229031.1 signal transduction histidine kinase/DNA-binding response OmpR family regulator [Sphingobacterium sp. BIGb0165]
MGKYTFYGILVLLLFLGCQSASQKKKRVIAFSQCIGNDAWRQTMLEEMKRELSFNPDIEFLYRDAQGNNAVQIDQIRELTKAGIDLLIVSPNEAEPLTPIVDSVFQRKIPVIVTDRKTSSGQYNAYVGADNLAIGKLAGQYSQAVLQGKGRVGLVTGLSGTSASIEREKGFMQSISAVSGMQVCAVIHGGWEKNIAYTEMREHIAQMAQSDIIFTFNDQMAMGVKKALDETPLQKDIKIIGVDALPGPGNGLEQIIQGHMYASMLYPTGGTEAIRTALAIINNQQYRRENILATAVIDRTNAELLALQSQKIQQQQVDIDKRQEFITEQNRIYQNQKNVLNVLVVSLVLAVVFGGISIIVIKSNWEKNKHLELQNGEILSQQKQIVEMNSQIQQAAEIKNNFFTNISHEFKTPLTLILAPIEDLEMRKDLSEDIKEQLSRVKRSAKKLQRLVSDLIDIHRISKAKIKLQVSAVPIDPFIQQVINSFKPLLKKSRISISYINKSMLKEVWIDEYLMEQVLSNLLSNAIKHTATSGRIEISLEENSFKDYFYLRVLDNGLGIAPIDIEHIFDPFYQGTGSRNGSGIGLAYVKQIVELHHGQITASSKLGHGSIFTLRMPIGNTHYEQEEIITAVSGVKPVFKQQDFLDTEVKSSDKNLSFHSNKSKSIMIVEDDDEIRDYLRSILKNDYNLFLARDSHQAGTLMKAHFPDLVLTDIMLPDGSGLDILKDIKTFYQTAHIPVILLSALANEETILEGSLLKADDYITKPFNAALLRAKIANMLQSRHQLKEKYSSNVEQFDSPQSDTINESDRRFLNSFSAIVESKLSDQRLSVDDIAGELNLSRVQLYRKVKQLLDCSISEYIVERRLKKAKSLMADGLNINEIYSNVGFSSASYFASAFKKKYGQSPSTFKKELDRK